MFNTSTRQPIVTFDRHNDDLSLWFYKVFQKLNSCVFKKNKNMKRYLVVFSRTSRRSVAQYQSSDTCMFCFVFLTAVRTSDGPVTS